MWQPKQVVPGSTWVLSTLVSTTGTVVPRSSKLRPIPTIRAWLVVTRYELLWLVGQLAKNASVLMNPTLGVEITSSAVAASRSLGTSQKIVRSSPALGGRMVIIRQLLQSSVVNWPCVDPQPGRPPNRISAAAMSAAPPVLVCGSLQFAFVPR